MSRDRGSTAVEMTIVATPVFLTLALFTVFCGRTAAATIDVSAAAGAGARSAADAHSAGAAREAAVRTANATLAGHRWQCVTSTDTGAFRLGGRVQVTVVCTVPLADLGLPVGTDRTVSASAIEPIDQYREWP